MQGSLPIACGNLGFCLLCVGQCLFFQHPQMTVESGVETLDPLEKCLGQFDGGQRAGFNLGRGLRDGQEMQIGYKEALSASNVADG